METKLRKEFKERIYARLEDIMFSVRETFPGMRDGFFDIFTPSLSLLNVLVFLDGIE
ncbi:MAG: hypothetical protein U5R49_12665 [Deltaproteobacteria bacterium]|nr:hypothetical protein [Deltaproteobacteria bacterium]